MAVSKAQQKAVNKYMAANYDRINLTVPKGRKEEIQAFAAQTGESVNGFINRAIGEAMGESPQQPAAARRSAARRGGYPYTLRAQNGAGGRAEGGRNRSGVCWSSD